jgi:hypothetical protein
VRVTDYGPVLKESARRHENKNEDQGTKNNRTEACLARNPMVLFIQT